MGTREKCEDLNDSRSLLLAHKRGNSKLRSRELPMLSRRELGSRFASVPSHFINPHSIFEMRRAVRWGEWEIRERRVGWGILAGASSSCLKFWGHTSIKLSTSNEYGTGPVTLRTQGERILKPLRFTARRRAFSKGGSVFPSKKFLVVRSQAKSARLVSRGKRAFQEP